MAANPEKLAGLFGLADDTELVSLANDIVYATRPIIPGNLSTGLLYAALEMAYVHLGRPALAPHRPAFQSKSGLSESNYQQLIGEKMQTCIRSEEMRRGKSETIPSVINSVQSILKGLGISEFEPKIVEVETQFLAKMGVARGECNIIPLAVTLACLAINPKIFGLRGSALRLESMATAFLVFKKKPLQEMVRNVQVKCDVALKALKGDKAFESALVSALPKLTSSSASRPSAIIHNKRETFCDFEMEIEASAAVAAEPLPKRKRPSDGMNVDILEGYGDSWGPRGILPLLSFQHTSSWRRIEDLDRKHLQSIERLQTK